MIAITRTLGLASSILSFGFFLLCRYLIRPLTFYRLPGTPKDQQSRTVPERYVQTWFTYPDEDRWHRLNLLISWIHALITGILVLYSFWAYAPELNRDFVTHMNLVTYLTCSLSFGRRKARCFYLSIERSLGLV